MQPQSYRANIATLIGILALFFWAISATLILLVGELPVFEMQLIVYTFSFMLALFKFQLLLFKTLFTLPLKLIAFGLVGTYLNNFFFISAFKHAPPEKVDLINYLWPIMVILFSSLLPDEKLRPHQLVGALLSFFGIYLLLSETANIESQLAHWKGYGLAFLGAICWTFFTLMLRKNKKSPAELMGIYCGISAIFSLISHRALENFIMPTASQFFYLALIGLSAQGLAYYFWDIGIKKGHYQLLCVLSYFNPILSVGLLILFGFSSFTNSLLVAMLLVSLGAIIASEKFNNILIHKQSPPA